MGAGHRRGKGSAGCPVGEVLQLLGKPYVLSILNAFSTTPTPLRFIQLQRQLEVSPNTLAQRLRALTDAGLLYRTPYAEIPPRVDYLLTPKARELVAIFDDLHGWASRNDLSPVPSPPSGVGKRAVMA